MQKILLAIGFRQLEEYLKKQLKEFLFVGETVYREGILRAIGQKKPDIVIIRETLEGSQDILSILYEIRAKYPKVRIVFLAGNRKPGDVLLSTVVSYGIYDVLYGDKIRAQDIIQIVRNPNEYVHVQHLQPKVMLDETRNQVLYDAPDIEQRVVTKEVVVIKEDSPDDSLGDSLKSAGHFSTLDEKDKDVSPLVEDKKEDGGLGGSPSRDPSLDAVNSQEKALRANWISSVKAVWSKSRESRSKERSQSWTSLSDSTESKPLFEKEAENARHVLSGTRMIAFIGARHGVGTSTIAYAFACHLAQKGYRVLYLDPSDFPSVSYWYEVGELDRGLDRAIESVEKEEYSRVKEAISQGERIREKQKQHPSSLDVLLFSQVFMTRRERERLFDPYVIKDLYLHLLLHTEYDYIVMDLSPSFDSFFHYALVYAKRVFLVLTQDIAVMGSGLFLLNEIRKNYPHQTGETLYCIVNMFHKKALSIREMEECMEERLSFSVPNLYAECIRLQFRGRLFVPALSAFVSEFNKIEQVL
ncbi:UNVERIFIED_ORG: cellulose biosynthesis protein BcsQ [Anoxybacillus amylolyticus]